MIFGGIFKVWFGGKAKARHVAILKQQIRLSQASSSNDTDPTDNQDQTDNTENTTPGADSSLPEIAGVLALDRNATGIIDPANDTAFQNDKPGAASDLEGLEAFDSNADGVIDIHDPAWQKFGIWVDANKDGQCQSGEFKTLASLGFASIDLDAGATNGTVHVTATNGSEGLLALGLASNP